MINIPGLTVSGQLGEGGTAAVAKAFSKELNREVAVKYPLENKPDSVAEFKKLISRENELIGKIRYPGIVQILHYSDNPPYLLLELCQGKMLDRFSKIDDVPTLLNLLSAVAVNLEFLRIKELVHCDLKPNNIFLPKEDSVLNSDRLYFVKISDFSLGKKQSESESARTGHGTIGYAAPETLASSTISHRSDLFSLGVMAYKLATGIHPFMHGETDPVKIESRVREDDPPPVSSHRKDLPDKFSDLVGQILSKDFSERPQTAWSVCKKLEEIGCKYPYRKAFSPAFILKNSESYHQATSYLDLDKRQASFLKQVTGEKTDDLRLLLTANFNRNNLKYEDGQFRFNAQIYWPFILRRRVFNFFSAAPLGLKRRIVREAVKNNFGESDNAPAGSPLLFQNLLSNAFIKRSSRKLAEQAESDKEFGQAAKLYLQAGRLEEACQNVEISAKEATDEDEIKNSIQLIDRIVAFSKDIKNEFATCRAQMSKGDLLRNSGFADEATETYQAVIELYKDRQSDKQLADVYRGLGRIHNSRQNFEAGIELLNKAMEIYRHEKDDLEISRTIRDLGSVYCVASRLPESISYYRQALHIQRKLKADADASTTLNNIGSIYGMMGRLSRTIWLLKITLKMKREIGDQGELARTLNNLSYAHQLSGQVSESVRYIKEAVEINRRLGSKRELLSNLWNLSEIMAKTGRLSESIEFVQEGLELSLELNLKPHQAHFKKSLGNIMHRLGRYSEAEDAYDKTEEIIEGVDDRVLEIRLLTGRAALRYEIGDRESATKLAEDALEMTTAVTAKPEAMSALLVLIKATGKEHFIENARLLADELKLEREKILVEYSFAQHLLEKKGYQKAAEITESYLPELPNIPEDIELPGLLNAAAEAYSGISKNDRADSLLKNSEALANTAGLVADELTSLSLRGGIAFDQSDYELAYVQYKKALNLCKQMAKNIRKKEDLNLFMNKREIKRVTDGIKLLGEKMVRKQKTGA